MEVSFALNSWTFIDLKFDIVCNISICMGLLGVHIETFTSDYFASMWSPQHLTILLVHASACICWDTEYAGSLESMKESVRVAWGAAESNCSQRAKKVVSDSPGLVDFAIRQVNSVLKVAQYSFSGSIPPKFEHKLSCHKQRFRKIATAVVSDKDENLLW